MEFLNLIDIEQITITLDSLLHSTNGFETVELVVVDENAFLTSF